LSGGYAAAPPQLVELRLDGMRDVTVVLKRARPAEVVALRAVDVVPGVTRPRLVAAGADWLVLPYYGDAALGRADPVPDEVYETLGRIHHHYLGRPPAGLTVVDAAFWQQLCGEIAGPAALAAGMPDVAEALTAWAHDDRMLAALALLPHTLVHGDMHRGNVLLGPAGPTIIDWGNTRIAAGGLDLAVLAAQGGTDQGRYQRTVTDVERHWAVAQAHTQYLAFAADHLGEHRTREMAATIERALHDLGLALAKPRGA